MSRSVIARGLMVSTALCVMDAGPSHPNRGMWTGILGRVLPDAGECSGKERALWEACQRFVDADSPAAARDASFHLRSAMARYLEDRVGRQFAAWQDHGGGHGVSE